MTVGQMQAEMSNAEYVRWGVYYGRKAQRAEMEAAKAKGKR
jgi:hypothetical protein